MARISVSFLAVGLAVVLAGCSNPKSKLMASCMKENANNRELCTCVVNQLSDALTPEQLAALANAEDTEGGQEAAMRTLGQDGAMKMVGAMKACGAVG